MKTHQPKKADQTLFIPSEISQGLRKAYRAATKDPGQLEAKEWENTIADGFEEWVNSPKP